MFKGCSLIKIPPKINAYKLKEECCYAMFCGCENPTAAPVLLAAKTNDKSYCNMFQGCKSLKKRPVMPKKAYLEALAMNFIPSELVK